MGWLFDSPEEKLMKAQIELKMAAKQMQRESKKAQSEEKKQKDLVAHYIKQGNEPSARIAAENSIRAHSQAYNYLKMSSRVDAVAGRVQQACATGRVTKNMTQVVRSMESAMKSMNLEQIQNMMDRFEGSFEKLDVQTEIMDSAMQGTSVGLTPQNDVNKLMQEQADLAGITLSEELPGVGTGTLNPGQSETVIADDLEKRLAKMRQETN